MTESVKDLASLIGRAGTWDAAPGLTLQIVITDVRKVYGRTDYQIAVRGHGGHTWVGSENVHLSELSEEP